MEGFHRRYEDKSGMQGILEELLNEELDWKKEDLEKVSRVPGECEEFRFGEVMVAIKYKAKFGKAPGPKTQWTSGVVADMLQQVTWEYSE